MRGELKHFLYLNIFENLPDIEQNLNDDEKNGCSTDANSATAADAEDKKNNDNSSSSSSSPDKSASESLTET